MIDPSDRGLTINIWAVEGLASMGFCLAALDSFAKALASASGLPESLALPASASYSLDLDMAIWMTVAAIGAIIAMAITLIVAPDHHSEYRRPPGQHNDGAGYCCRHGADQNIFMLDMRQFMGDDAFQFIPGSGSSKYLLSQRRRHDLHLCP